MLLFIFFFFLCVFVPFLIDINNIHFKPYVVGDLSKENAEEFFEKHVLMQCESFESFLQPFFGHMVNAYSMASLLCNI